MQSLFLFSLFCAWFGVLCCRYSCSFLFLASLFGKNSGAKFCFWVSDLVLCFLWCFKMVFALCVGGLLPKLFGNILLMSGLVFFGLVLSSLGFFVDVVFGFCVLVF